MTTAILLIAIGFALMYAGFLGLERHRRKERQRAMLRHLEDVCK